MNCLHALVALSLQRLWDFFFDMGAGRYMQIQYRSCGATVPCPGPATYQEVSKFRRGQQAILLRLDRVCSLCCGYTTVCFLLFPLLFQLRSLLRLAENLGTLHYNEAPFIRPACRAWMEIDGKEF